MASGAVGAAGDLASGAADAVGDLASGAADLAGDAVGAVGNVASGAVDLAGDAVGAVGDAASGAVGAVGDAVGDIASGGIGALPKILGALALAALAFFFLRSCGDGNSLKDAAGDAMNSTTQMVKDGAGSVKDGAANMAEKTGEMAGKAVDGAADMAKSGVDAAGNAMDKAGDMASGAVDSMAAMGKKIGDKFRFSLPGGLEVDVPEGSFESELLKNIGSADAEFGKSYVLDRIYFETGSYNLTAESADQLTTMSNILKAYPDLTATLRGHTDSTGNADNNLALSLKRANAVKGFLTNLGLDTSRIATVGKGPAEPIADNGTAEGRALNRRIDIAFNKGAAGSPSIETP